MKNPQNSEKLTDLRILLTPISQVFALTYVFLNR